MTVPIAEAQGGDAEREADALRVVAKARQLCVAIPCHMLGVRRESRLLSTKVLKDFQISRTTCNMKWLHDLGSVCAARSSSLAWQVLEQALQALLLLPFFVYFSGMTAAGSKQRDLHFPKAWRDRGKGILVLTSLALMLVPGKAVMQLALAEIYLAMDCIPVASLLAYVFHADLCGLNPAPTPAQCEDSHAQALPAAQQSLHATQLRDD